MGNSPEAYRVKPYRYNAEVLKFFFRAIFWNIFRTVFNLLFKTVLNECMNLNP
jgi:hypothetical protein